MNAGMRAQSLLNIIITEINFQSCKFHIYFFSLLVFGFNHISALKWLGVTFKWINGNTSERRRRDYVLPRSGGACCALCPDFYRQCLWLSSLCDPTVLPAKTGGAFTDFGLYSTESCCVFETAAAS